MSIRNRSGRSKPTKTLRPKMCKVEGCSNHYLGTLHSKKCPECRLPQGGSRKVIGGYKICQVRKN